MERMNSHLIEDPKEQEDLTVVFLCSVQKSFLIILDKYTYGESRERIQDQKTSTDKGDTMLKGTEDGLL